MYERHVHGNLHGNPRFVFVIASPVVIDRNSCNPRAIFTPNEGNGPGQCSCPSGLRRKARDYTFETIVAKTFMAFLKNCNNITGD